MTATPLALRQHGAALSVAVAALRPAVEAHITPDRVRRYLSRIADTPAPSTAAGAFRIPVLKALWHHDGVLGMPGLHLSEDFRNTGSPVLLTGSPEPRKPLWYFAHLDTISYLVQPRRGEFYPLVPFCYHLAKDGVRQACAYRYDFAANRYASLMDGELHSRDGEALFRPGEAGVDLRPGDRIVPVAAYTEDPTSGDFIGHMDNAGGVAALAVAAPVLAQAHVEALLALPDEEEGPPGSGSQLMGRGGSRIVSHLPPPDIAVISDVQQAGGAADADTRAGVENSTRLGQGAVLAEFSSLARGAVTPPHLYALARQLGDAVVSAGVRVQESNNAYTSRSDDVSVLLKTPNILLLGFAGFNRHFDLGPPRANLHDVVHLAKALVYCSALIPAYRDLRARMRGRTHD